MIRMFTLISLAVLVACAGPVPKPDPGKAWVELSSTAGDLLMADRLDGERLDDGRFFQVPPGEHELQARFQFEVPGGGGLEPLAEPVLRTCVLRVRYADFSPGQRYRLAARAQGYRAQAWLYDEQRQLLARGKLLRCGSF